MSNPRPGNFAVARCTPHASTLLALALSAWAPIGLAESNERSIDWKLTYSHHRAQSERDGIDLNLRGTRESTVFWLGSYRRANEFEQSRGGLEQTLSFHWGKLLLSGQAATHGFLGYATQAEFGSGSVRPLLGFGRTNLKPYYNLNFDPNDMVMVGLVADLPQSMKASLYAIHDDRLGTGQTVLHALLRTSGDTASRWTIDLAQRRGPLGVAGPFAVRTGLGATYDRSAYFGRVVYDPNANFSGHDMVRLSLGMRF